MVFIFQQEYEARSLRLRGKQGVDLKKRKRKGD